MFFNISFVQAGLNTFIFLLRMGSTQYVMKYNTSVLILRHPYIYKEADMNLSQTRVLKLFFNTDGKLRSDAFENASTNC